MVSSIIGLVLALIGLTALALQRFYSSVPAKELRRLAARGDRLALSLYSVVAYNGSLRLVLWTLASLNLTGAAVLLARGLPVSFGFVVILVLLFLGFVVMQSVKLTVKTASFTAAVAVPLARMLSWIEPALGKITHHVRKHRTFIAHSGMYEKEDLVDLLDQQKDQADNRISHEELALARRALHFDETQAADIMTARTHMKTLKPDDTAGPILFEELYKSGQASFVVYADEAAMGTVQLQEVLKMKQGGKVASIMNKDLVFVHEDFTLRQVTDACLKTGQSLVVVINAFEEIVGVISLDSLLDELFGGPQETDLPYQNRATIAAYKPAAQKPAAEPESTEVQPEASESTEFTAKTDIASPDAPEVVK